LAFADNLRTSQDRLISVEEAVARQNEILRLTRLLLAANAADASRSLEELRQAIRDVQAVQGQEGMAAVARLESRFAALEPHFRQLQQSVANMGERCNMFQITLDRVTAMLGTLQRRVDCLSATPSPVTPEEEPYIVFSSEQVRNGW
jgi:hypothetical protein